MEILFQILQAVENIKLDPSVLEPEPVEIGDEKGEKKVQAVAKTMPEGNVFLLCYLLYYSVSIDIGPVHVWI